MKYQKALGDPATKSGRDELEKLGIEITHTGEFLTNALKDETFSVLTI